MKGWVIPPNQNSDFVANMENVLDIYKRPYCPKNPVVCMDESPKQLIGETKHPIRLKDGSKIIDYEYKRNGVCNIFMANEPLFEEIGKEQTLNIIDGVELTGPNNNIEVFGLDGSDSTFNRLFREAGTLWLSRGFISDTISPKNAYTDKFINKYTKD